MDLFSAPIQQNNSALNLLNQLLAGDKPKIPQVNGQALQTNLPATNQSTAPFTQSQDGSTGPVSAYLQSLINPKAAPQLPWQTPDGITSPSATQLPWQTPSGSSPSALTSLLSLFGG